MHHHSTTHHISKRKRIHSRKEKYPHPNKHMKLLDNLCLVFSVLMPMTALPQIIEIFKTKNVEALSLLMWVFYCIGVIPFLIYGIVHREKHLIILNVLWLMAQITIITGILIYS